MMVLTRRLIMTSNPRLLLIWVFCASFQAAGAEMNFDKDVRPILARCVKCHGPEKQKGGLRLDSRAGAVGKGDSGSEAIVPGEAAESELIRRIESKDDSERMPPKGEPLSPEQVAMLRLWIDRGLRWPESPGAVAAGRSEMVVTAEDRQHWSYRPLAAVKPPVVEDDDWCATEVDRFVLAGLEAKGLRPNPRADRRTLIRRVYFDLIGLPPTPEEVESFASDPKETAYAELVDKLLDSRHYGERWGRHWLDLTRYADSDGLETDAERPNAWHYRDFVIRAFNDDLSFQTFVRWQLAGDEYEPDDPRALAATGFLTTAPIEMLAPKLLEEERLRLRFNELDDTAVTTTAAFLGLTLGCARCHDHKFDAIPTRDYYRMQAAFIGTARGDVFLASREAVAKFQKEDAAWNSRVKPMQKKLDDWLTATKATHEAGLRRRKIEALPVSDADKTVLKERPESEQGKKLGRTHEKKLALTDADFRSVFTPEQRSHWDALQKELDLANRSRPRSPDKALAITETSREPQETWLLNRGDFS